LLKRMSVTLLRITLQEIAPQAPDVAYLGGEIPESCLDSPLEAHCGRYVLGA
jgi:hypothetical protein